MREAEHLAKRRAAATAELWVPVALGKVAERHLGELVKGTAHINGMMLGKEDETALMVRFSDLEQAQVILAEKMPGCKYSVKRDMTL